MLTLEPLLAARLLEIDGLKGVYGLPELAGSNGAGKPGPCVYLIFDGYKVLENSANGQSSRLESRWLVVLSIKHAGQAADGAPARSAAAPWVSALLGQLLGWRPSPEHSPLFLAGAPRADFRAGSLLLPLAFTCAHVVRGTFKGER